MKRDLPQWAVFAALLASLSACAVNQLAFDDGSARGDGDAAATCPDANTSRDLNNCGGCGRVCSADGLLLPHCVRGNCVRCRASEEPGPELMCVPIAVGGDGGHTCSNPNEAYCANVGTCVDLQSNMANCGMCNRPCTSGQVCASGGCVAVPPMCLTGYTLCAGMCWDTTGDSQNCGACGVNCSGRACIHGACAAMDGGVTCNPWCTLTAGRCVCPADGGATEAGLVCPGTEVNCNGTCTVTNGSDVNNCGACGHRCTAPASCVMGTCTCPSQCPDNGSGACVCPSDAGSFDAGGFDASPSSCVCTTDCSISGQVCVCTDGAPPMCCGTPCGSSTTCPPRSSCDPIAHRCCPTLVAS